jgi:hypothetical protein
MGLSPEVEKTMFNNYILAAVDELQTAAQIASQSQNEELQVLQDEVQYVLDKANDLAYT